MLRRPIESAADSRLSDCNMRVQYSERPHPTLCRRWKWKDERPLTGAAPRHSTADVHPQLGKLMMYLQPPTVSGGSPGVHHDRLDEFLRLVRAFLSDASSWRQARLQGF